MILTASSDTGIRVVILFCLVREVAVCLTFLDYVITYDRSIGTKEAFMQEAANFVLGVLCSDPRVEPAARRRHDTDPPAGRCSFDEGESAGPRFLGSTRGSAKNGPRVMVA